MQIVAIYVVRDEEVLLGASIRHHLAYGVDQVLVIDNGSSDGTPGVLEELARDGRVRWTRDEGPFRSAEMFTGLAREAAREGAAWVVPTAPDEFWHAPGSNLGAALAANDARALEVDVVTFVQRRGQHRQVASALLTMNRRVAQTVPSINRFEPMLRSNVVAYAEMDQPTRVIFRASPTVNLSPGAHVASDDGLTPEPTSAIRLLHAPLFARSVLEAKAARGRRIKAAGFEPGHSVHLRRWSEMPRHELLDLEWAANSYDEADGTLLVRGARVATVEDNALRDLARPWVPEPADEPAEHAERRRQSRWQALRQSLDRLLP